MRVKMNKYIIEHEILTILRNNYVEWTIPITSFKIDDIEFSQWNYSIGKWSFWDQWLCKSTIEALDYHEALKLHFYKLNKIIPKIAFIGQAYINHNYWSILISKWDIWLLFYRYPSKGGWLPFWKKEQNILNNIFHNPDVPQEFYSYWYDLINTTWYSWKILLLCSAIESLLPKKFLWYKLTEAEQLHNRERNELRKKIIWDELDNELFWRNDIGLRHRLIHWEYFSQDDFQKDYVYEIHKKIIEYFNNEIIKIDWKISLNVIYPQRHPYWNYKQAWSYLKANKDFSLNLKDIINNIPDNNLNNITGYSTIWNIIDF